MGFGRARRVPRWSVLPVGVLAADVLDRISEVIHVPGRGFGNEAFGSGREPLAPTGPFPSLARR